MALGLWHMTDIKPGTRIAGRYTIRRPLGGGGNASTWLAADAAAGRDVVLKVLFVQDLAEWKTLDLFQREAEVLRSLDHPLIPDYVDHGETETNGVLLRYLAQEYADGDDLHTLVGKGRRFSVDEVRRMLVELLGVLEYIHDLRPPLLHRDIKPENIVLDRSGRTYLVDFSAAGAVRSTAAEAGRSDTFVGTAGYMPPEQYYGRGFPQSDLFSLGVTMVFLLTGREPAEMELAGGRPDLSGLASLPADLRELVEVCTAPGWSDRPASARRARELLERSSQVKETAADDALIGTLRTGPSHTLFRRHLTTEAPFPPGKDGLPFLVHLLERAFISRGTTHHGPDEHTLSWIGDAAPSVTVCARRRSSALRLDITQPALSVGLLVMVGVYCVFMSGLFFSAFPWLTGLIPILTAWGEPTLVHWAVLAAALFAVYAVITWFFRRARLRRAARRLVRLLDALPRQKKTPAYTELLAQPSFINEGRPRHLPGADIRCRLSCKWRLRRGGDRSSRSTIEAALERVMAKKEGDISEVGLGLRWIHKKSAWTVTFTPRPSGTDIEVAVDRRSYGSFYAVGLFLFTFLGALLVNGMQEGIRETGGVAFPFGFFACLAAPLLGQLCNALLCLFHRLRARRLVRLLVRELEDAGE